MHTTWRKTSHMGLQTPRNHPYDWLQPLASPIVE